MMTTIVKFGINPFFHSISAAIGREVMGINEQGYYSLREILGYGAKYNIVLSDRGRGKSWGTKWFLMNQPGTFMCLYRQSGDMSLAVKDWLDPILKGDADHQPMESERFSWEGSDKDGWQLIVDGSVKGYFRFITAVNRIKQEVFPDDLNWVWWDEFIPLVYKKLAGVVSEGDALRAIVKTIEHDTVHSREEKGLKPVRVLMFANPFTWNNPILGYFHVQPRYGIYRIGPGIVCEHLEPYFKEIEDKMTADDFLGDEVNRNQGWLDQMAFIVPFPKSLEPRLSIRIGEEFFGIYRRSDGTGPWYIKQLKQHISCDHIFGTVEGLREDESTIFFDAKGIGATLREIAYQGRGRYDNINTKFAFINAIS